MLNKLLRFLLTLLGLLLIFSSPLIIYAVDPEPVIRTVAGTNQGFSGDGDLATVAQFNDPADTAVDSAGNIYIADTSNHRIRKVIAATGVVTTIAGTGTPGFSGDSGPGRRRNSIHLLALVWIKPVIFISPILKIIVSVRSFRRLG